jgi:hypothetical protein
MHMVNSNAVKQPNSQYLCRNCASSAPGKFCPQCGQSTALHPPSAGEFIHEFIGHYVALEGKLWRTMGLLLARPGRLTREYLAGRKVRYVLPLRLYLTISLIFFIGLSVSASLDNASLQQEAAKKNVTSNPKTVQLDFDFGGLKAKIGKEANFSCSLPSWFCHRLEPRFELIRKNPETEMARITNEFRRNLPYAMFLLMPMFGLLLKMVYRKKGILFGEHLVFTLHVHSAWFFFTLFAMFFQSLDGLLLLGLPIYTCFAMKQVYGGRKRGVLARASMLFLLYFLCSIAVVAMLFVLGLLS